MTLALLSAARSCSAAAAAVMMCLYWQTPVGFTWEVRMTTPLPIVEAFSVSHAQICDGVTTFDEYLASAAFMARENEDIYGVNESSLEPDTDDYDNEGDDAVLSSWAWMNFAELSVQAGYITFPMIANLTNRPYTSTGAGAAISYKMDLWHEATLNVPPRPMIIQMPSRDARGAPRLFTFGLYKVQFAPIGFEGPSYKEGLKVNYNGKVLMTKWDEKGLPHADGKSKAGVLLSTPA